MTEEFCLLMKAKKRPVRAYSYIRFSSPEQAKGDSLRRQLEQTIAYCDEFKLVLDTGISLRDLGLSAFKGANISKGMLGKFLHLVEAGKIEKGSVLIIENLDRLSRAQIGDAVHLFMSIVRSGVDIVTLTDRRRFNAESLNNPMELMLSIMTFYRSHDESAQKSYRARKTWEQKRKQAAVRALTSRCPAWLQLDPSTGKFHPHKDSAATVREVFKRSIQGMGHHTIARNFNQEKVTPIGRASHWHGSYVAKILKNRAVLGEFQPYSFKNGRRSPDGQCIANYFPAIIDEATFNTVQVKKSNRAGKLGRPTSGGIRNLFTGVARCGYCGARMQFVNKGQNSRALVCSNAIRGLGCKYVGYPLIEIERTFLDFTKELDLSTLVDDKDEGDSISAIQESEGKLATLDGQLKNLTEAISAGTSGSPPAVVIKRIQELESIRSEELKRLQKIKQELGTKRPAASRVKVLKEFLRTIDIADDSASLTRSRLAELIRSVVLEVTLFAAGRSRGTFNPAPKATRNGPHPWRHYFVHFKNEAGHRLVVSGTSEPGSGRIFVTGEEWNKLLKSRAQKPTVQNGTAG